MKRRQDGIGQGSKQRGLATIETDKSVRVRTTTRQTQNTGNIDQLEQADASPAGNFVVRELGAKSHQQSMVNFYCADEIDRQQQTLMQQSSDTKLNSKRDGGSSIDNKSRKKESHLIRSAMDMDQASASSPYQVYAGKARMAPELMLVKRQTTAAAPLKNIERMYDQKQTKSIYGQQHRGVSGNGLRAGPAPLASADEAQADLAASLSNQQQYQSLTKLPTSQKSSSRHEGRHILRAMTEATNGSTSAQPRARSNPRTAITSQAQRQAQKLIKAATKHGSSTAVGGATPSVVMNQQKREIAEAAAKYQMYAQPEAGRLEQDVRRALGSGAQMGKRSVAVTFLATDETCEATEGVTAVATTKRHTVDNLSPIAAPARSLRRATAGLGRTASRRGSHEGSDSNMPHQNNSVIIENNIASGASSTYGQVTLRPGAGPRRLATLEQSRQGAAANQLVGILRDPSTNRRRGTNTQAQVSGANQARTNSKASVAYQTSGVYGQPKANAAVVDALGVVVPRARSNFRSTQRSQHRAPQSFSNMRQRPTRRNDQSSKSPPRTKATLGSVAQNRYQQPISKGKAVLQVVDQQMSQLEAMRQANGTGSSGGVVTKLSASLGVDQGVVQASAGTNAVTIPAMELDLKSQMILPNNKVARQTESFEYTGITTNGVNASRLATLQVQPANNRFQSTKKNPRRNIANVDASKISDPMLSSGLQTHNNMQSTTEFDKASSSIPPELLMSNAASLPDETRDILKSEKARKDNLVSLLKNPKTAASANPSSSKLDKAYESALTDAISRDRQMLQSIQRNWAEVNSRIIQRTSLLHTLQTEVVGQKDENSSASQLGPVQPQGPIARLSYGELDILGSMATVDKPKKTGNNRYDIEDHAISAVAGSADGKSQTSQQVHSFIIDNQMSQGEDEAEVGDQPKQPIDLNTISSLNAEHGMNAKSRAVAVRYLDSDPVQEQSEERMGNSEGEFDVADISQQANLLAQLRNGDDGEALLLESGLFCVSANNLHPADAQKLQQSHSINSIKKATTSNVADRLAARRNRPTKINPQNINRFQSVTNPPTTSGKPASPDPRGRQKNDIRRLAQLYRSQGKHANPAQTSQVVPSSQVTISQGVIPLATAKPMKGVRVTTRHYAAGAKAPNTGQMYTKKNAMSLDPTSRKRTVEPPLRTGSRQNSNNQPTLMVGREGNPTVSSAAIISIESQQRYLARGITDRETRRAAVNGRNLLHRKSSHRRVDLGNGSNSRSLQGSRVRGASKGAVAQQNALALAANDIQSMIRSVGQTSQGTTSAERQNASFNGGKFGTLDLNRNVKRSKRIEGYGMESSGQLNFKNQQMTDDSRVVNGMSTLNAVTDALEGQNNSSQDGQMKFMAARLSSTGIIQQHNLQTMTVGPSEKPRGQSKSTMRSGPRHNIPTGKSSNNQGSLSVGRQRPPVSNKLYASSCHGNVSRISQKSIRRIQHYQQNGFGAAQNLQTPILEQRSKVAQVQLSKVIQNSSVERAKRSTTSGYQQRGTIGQRRRTTTQNQQQSIAQTVDEHHGGQSLQSLYQVERPKGNANKAKLLSVEIKNDHDPVQNEAVMASCQMQRGLNESTLVNMNSPNAIVPQRGNTFIDGESRQILIKDFKSGHVYQNLSADTSALALVTDSQGSSQIHDKRSSLQAHQAAASAMKENKSGSQLINIVIGDNSSRVEAKQSSDHKQNENTMQGKKHAPSSREILSNQYTFNSELMAKDQQNQLAGQQYSDNYLLQQLQQQISSQNERRKTGLMSTGGAVVFEQQREASTHGSQGQGDVDSINDQQDNSVMIPGKGGDNNESELIIKKLDNQEASGRGKKILISQIIKKNDGLSIAPKRGRDDYDDENAANETINSSKLIMNQRDRKNVVEFLSANQSPAALLGLQFQGSDTTPGRMNPLVGQYESRAEIHNTTNENLLATADQSLNQAKGVVTKKLIPFNDEDEGEHERNEEDQEEPAGDTEQPGSILHELTNENKQLSQEIFLRPQNQKVDSKFADEHIQSSEHQTAGSGNKVTNNTMILSQNSVVRTTNNKGGEGEALTSFNTVASKIASHGKPMLGARGRVIGAAAGTRKSTFLFGTRVNTSLLAQNNLRYSQQENYGEHESAEVREDGAKKATQRNIQMKSAIGLNTKKLHKESADDEVAAGGLLSSGGNPMQKVEEATGAANIKSFIIDESQVVQEEAEASLRDDDDVILRREVVQSPQLTNQRSSKRSLLNPSDERPIGSTGQDALQLAAGERIMRNSMGKRNPLKDRCRRYATAASSESKELALSRPVQLVPSDQITENYAEEQDHTSTSQGEPSKGTSRKLIESADKIAGLPASSSAADDDVLLESINEPSSDSVKRSSSKGGKDQPKQNNFVDDSQEAEVIQSNHLPSELSVNLLEQSNDMLFDSSKLKKNNHEASRRSSININRTEPAYPCDFQQKWPEMGALGRDSTNSVLKSRQNSDDVVTPRRGLEASMSDDKLRLLAQEFSDSFAKDSALKESIVAKEAHTRNHVNETAMLSAELNEKDIDKSIILLDKPEGQDNPLTDDCYQDNQPVKKATKKPLITPRLFKTRGGADGKYNNAGGAQQRHESSTSLVARSESACNLEESSASDVILMNAESGRGGPPGLDSSKGRKRYDRDDELDVNESSASDRVKGAAQRSLMHLNLGGIIKH